ncbi:DUF4224 domain-containing protein [Microbulbifer variabilis]|jgi:hypothetical protein|uniref:DUF4224 domain-containing protein n=1 Tax=Microbulbifer variabilis TaxID=266805 RepID=A0ABY4V6U3_9GAMM|nr:DUF4224 domain-containing protein [Microbulbifer variabilis]USD19994.1 DUF4224 domain-containing protein [Microbulbifer variabilis]
MGNLLTKHEIARLTGAGAENAEEQKRILDANRIPYVLKKDRSPALTWEMVNQAILARGASKPDLAGVNLPPGFNLGAAS